MTEGQSFGETHPSRASKLVEVKAGSTIRVRNTDQVRQASIEVGDQTYILDHANVGSDTVRTMKIPAGIDHIKVSDGVLVEF